MPAPQMKGKWARGIEPRMFTWVIKDRLAAAERPGGYAKNHRKVRRMEEIIWLQQQGFTQVVSLLDSPHNLHAYEEMGIPHTQVAYGRAGGDLLETHLLRECRAAGLLGIHRPRHQPRPSNRRLP